MTELDPCPFCGGKQNGTRRTKLLSVHNVKLQSHLLAAFFGNILIRVIIANIWLHFGTGELTMAKLELCPCIHTPCLFG